MFARNKGVWTSNHFESTPATSQREDWYIVSWYMAEFWCTVSNIGFLLVARYHGSFRLLFAAMASIVSHAIPYQYLLWLDKFGVFVALTSIEWSVVVAAPWVLLLFVALTMVQGFDMYMARCKGKTWPHIVWHLFAAFVAHIYLSTSFFWHHVQEPNQ